MKFGKTLLNNQIPEWSRNYISYKALKGTIKQAATELPVPEDTLTSIIFQLDRELEKVNTFYVYKNSLIDRRLWILSEKYENMKEEGDELMLALKETRTQMDKLMWFSEMNSKGFRKILKKLDKKLGVETQAAYWETKVAVLPFAAPVQLRQELEKLNRWITTLSTLKVKEESPKKSSLKLARYTVDNEDISKAILRDDRDELERLLKDGDRTTDTILELAVKHESTQCLTYLVGLGLSASHKDINERNSLHRACIEPHSTKLITTLLSLEPDLATQIDFAGRRPLHYAAEANQPELVKILLKHAIQNQYYTIDGFSDPIWQDREGFTPLFFGIIHGSTAAVKEMIETGDIQNIDESFASGLKSPTMSSSGSTTSSDEIVPDYARSLHHPSSVALACKLGNLELLKLLISKGASVDLADEDGETPLLFAIRSRFVEGVKVLISEGNVDLNLSEKVNGWTPLMIAAIEGFIDIVNILLDGNADRDAVDYNKWTASEHAVFRGFLEIGKLTLSSNPTKYVRPYFRDKPEDATQNGVTTKTSKSVSRASRLYGHKYLTNLSMIIITLGSNDVRNLLSKKFIELSSKFQSDDNQRRLSLSVSATNASGEFPIIDLPNDPTEPFQPEPIVVFTPNPDEVVLRFDIIETFGSSRNSSVLARGTSLLTGDSIFSKPKGFKGLSAKASLRGQQTVPLVRSNDLDCIGSLGFEYLVITPFEHKNMRIGDRYTYYKSVDTKLIGHRGSGMNRKGSKLQVGENTVLSFITAASLGAEYIEFDVQLTKDLTPVVYHDWTVTETGYDIPLNSITSEQFLNLRRSGHIKEYHTGVSSGIHGEIISTTDHPPFEPSSPPKGPSTPGARRNRSHSFSSGKQNWPSSPPTNPFEFTQSAKNGKIKGNGPETIQSPFTTLAETLKRVPNTAGFNIEVKYPMIDEAEQDDLAQFQEINVYVDTILDCVYNNADQDRHIIFSSFHPEICLALNLKQPNYPVFFLTDAGTLELADVRCNSLQEAVRFAKQADLLGVVAASEPILMAPRLTQVIKETGLLLFTYGVLNNEVENAIAQKSYGVDAVIVDSVLPIRNGLRGD